MTYSSLAGSEQVLKGINLCVAPASIQFLMGPSGSGKTTLLLILAGLLTPTSGEVCLLGQSLPKLSRREREKFRLQHIGFVAQDFNLFPALTVQENLDFVMKYKGLRGAAAQEQAQDLLTQVGLAGKEPYFPHQLSGGQKQRVAIARALVGSPDLIMADEPTASLDGDRGYEIAALLQQLSREKHCTVLVVTHDYRIQEIADRILYLNNGQATTEDMR
ncbi:ABC transporter ATP-binding protein [Lyngbya confervoides]|uniref:ABC transporter ATP-binding protein n=1 Tax=Lyngbya confervoides BDU141951 TaxID=1574623 RepID=A0ABD4T7N6_9CYAN|nr:ABC transporter ATP-binding protein [Lyngbya confervoides]MCM1984478.1 ABC transporter ATP-binding protein [Lyngbya confervoides BDU141951]